MKSFVRFSESGGSAKTSRWVVHGVQNAALLGIISWYGPWRCYAFRPQPDTIFESRCLSDIALFCSEQTHEQRHKAKATSP